MRIVVVFMRSTLLSVLRITRRPDVAIASKILGVGMVKNGLIAVPTAAGFALVRLCNDV